VGSTGPTFELIIEHEVDRPDKKVVAADFIAYWKHVYGLAVTAGVRQYINFNWCVTVNDGIRLGRVDPFFPGTAWVDTIGLDYYSDFTASWAFDGSVTPFSTGFAKSLAYVRSKGLPFNCPEFSEAESGNDTEMQAWFTGVATFLNAQTDVTCTGIYMWSQASSAYQNANKTAGQDPSTGTAHLGKHNGIIAALALVGNNAVLTGTSQGLPSVATGVAVVSAADGKSATMTWAAPPGGDNVTGWWWYLGTGNTTSLVKQNTSPLAVTPRSVTIPNLTPSTTYSADVVPINSAGKAGFGAIATFTTATPGAVNHAPNIASFTAIPQAASPLAVDFNITATDPDGNPITITVTVTTPTVGASPDVFTMTSGTPVTRTYISDGTYLASAAVSDGTLTTTANVTFGISTTTTNTPGRNYNITGFLPGQDPRGVGQTILPIVLELDTSVTALEGQVLSPWNVFHKLAGSSFDPIGSQTYTGMAANNLFWSAVRLETTSFSTVVAIVGPTAQVTGAGTSQQIGIHDSLGNILTDELGNTALYSGSSVLAWLTGATDTAAKFVLPSPIINRTFGEFLYVSVFFGPGLTTYPTLYSAPNTRPGVATLGLTSADRYGVVASAPGGIPSILPFGSASHTNAPLWFGLLP
jgi:hypothetical protein